MRPVGASGAEPSEKPRLSAAGPDRSRPVPPTPRPRRKRHSRAPPPVASRLRPARKWGWLSMNTSGCGVEQGVAEHVIEVWGSQAGLTIGRLERLGYIEQQGVPKVVFTE
eukprot:365481-Chlamydomonas_euryale.AAC.3